MKSKFIRFTLLAYLVVSSAYSQQKNYLQNNGSISRQKVYGERVTLSEVDVQKAEVLPSVLPFIGGIVADHGLNFIKNQVKRSLKKYTGEYSASVTTSSPNDLKSLVLAREILPIDSTGFITASEFFLEVNKQNEAFFYSISIKKMGYSKAKLKNKYYFLDLAFEVEVTYLMEDGKKTSIKSKPVYYSLYDFMNNSNIQMPITDWFPSKKVMEISVKVTETNPYKVRLEKIQGFLEENGDLISYVTSKLKD